MNPEYENTPLNETPFDSPEAANPNPEKQTETVGFWTYLGLMLLFAIPIVGLIACIIFIFAPKNKSLKNYAGAALTRMIAWVIFAVLTVALLVGFLGKALLPAVNDRLGVEIGNIGEVVGLISDVKKGNYSNIIQRFRAPILESIGEAYAPILDEFSTGKYDEMIGQIKNEEYNQILDDLQSGKYDELVDQLDPEDYGELKRELEKAAKGEPSQVFDGLQAFLNDSPMNGLDLIS